MFGIFAFFSLLAIVGLTIYSELFFNQGFVVLLMVPILTFVNISLAMCIFKAESRKKKQSFKELARLCHKLSEEYYAQRALKLRPGYQGRWIEFVKLD